MEDWNMATYHPALGRSPCTLRFYYYGYYYCYYHGYYYCYYYCYWLISFTTYATHSCQNSKIMDRIAHKSRRIFSSPEWSVWRLRHRYFDRVFRITISSDTFEIVRRQKKKKKERKHQQQQKWKQETENKPPNKKSKEGKQEKRNTLNSEQELGNTRARFENNQLMSSCAK